MLRHKSTRSTLVLALLATSLLTFGTTLASNKPDEDVTTTAATPTTSTSTTTTHSDEHFSQDAFNSDLKTKKRESLFCPGVFRRGVNWPHAAAGTISSAPCPEGSNGTQYWECSPEGLWVTESPNTAFCRSFWFQDWTEKMERDVQYGNDIEVKPRYPLVEGDWGRLLLRIDAALVSAKMFWHFRTNRLFCLMFVEILKQTIRDPVNWDSFDIVERNEHELNATIENAYSYPYSSTQSTRDSQDMSTVEVWFLDILHIVVYRDGWVKLVVLMYISSTVIKRFRLFDTVLTRSLAIIKQFWNRVQSCFGELHKKLSQLISEWISQLVIQYKKMWDTCETPLLDMRIAKLEKALADLRMKEKPRTRLIAPKYCKMTLRKNISRNVICVSRKSNQKFLDKFLGHEELET